MFDQYSTIVDQTNHVVGRQCSRFEVGQILDVNPPILTVIARAIQLKRDKSKLEICNRHVLKSRELNPQSTQLGAFGISLSTRSETVHASVLKKAITVKGIYERGSLQSNSALTISLLYSECSFVAISRWAASGKSFKPLYNGSSIQIPTASAKFRICCLCRKVGHYDVECSSVDESCLAQVIAPEIRAQTSLSVSSGEERHNEAKPNNSDLGTKIVLATRELPFGLGQPPSRTLGDILKRRPSNEGKYKDFKHLTAILSFLSNSNHFNDDRSQSQVQGFLLHSAGEYLQIMISLQNLWLVKFVIHLFAKMMSFFVMVVMHHTIFNAWTHLLKVCLVEAGFVEPVHYMIPMSAQLLMWNLVAKT